MTRRNPEAIGLIAQSMHAMLSGDSPLEAGENIYDFVRRYNISIDNIPIDYDGQYKHLLEIAEDTHPDITLMAGAQTGKSILLMLNLLRDAIVNWGAMLGYYFPDNHLPRAFSNRRFAPFIRQNDTLGPWLGKGAKKGEGQDAVFTRTLGPSTFFFLSVKGLTATEGLPMGGVYFDEVRRMAKGDIERAMERTSAQTTPRDFKVSTANLPEQDIHSWFLRGDQRWFHTDCACPDGVILSKTFPDCIDDLSNASSARLREVANAFDRAGMAYLGMNEMELEQYGQAAYVCPTCQTVITDPRAGWWEPENPEAFAHSYQMPQLLSPAMPAARIWKKYNEAEDMQEVWNSGVGIPWVDPESQPVQLMHLQACVNPNIQWFANMSDAWVRKHARNCALGVDVQAGYNICVVKMLSPNGKFRTVHLEVTHGDDPWKDTGRLMHRFDVRIAVVDGEPAWNEALRFIKAFKGRAWVADETDGKSGPMVSWKDTGKKKDQKGAETRFKYGVSIHRTKGLRWSLGRWVRGSNETPDPRRLLQRLPTRKGRIMFTSGLRIGRWGQAPLCRDAYWPHMQAVAFKKLFTKEEAERQGKYRWVAEHVGLDPHFAHADMFANVALARIGSPAKPRQV